MEAQPEAQAETTQAEALQGATHAVTPAETHASPPDVSGGASSSSEVVGSAAAFVESAASFVESTARTQQGAPLSDHEQHIEHLVRGAPARVLCTTSSQPQPRPTCYPRAISRETEPLRDPPPPWPSTP